MKRWRPRHRRAKRCPPLRIIPAGPPCPRCSAGTLHRTGGQSIGADTIVVMDHCDVCGYYTFPEERT